MTTMTGGEAVVRTLHEHGVDTLFCLPGVQNDWLFNALYDDGKMRIIHTRHEQGAGYMALGYAMATGGVGVYSVVPGPGFLNASAALATAYGLNARVLCLSGQIPSTDIGRDFGHLHEIPDQMSIMRSLTKWSERTNHASEIPATLGQAFKQLSSGRPRPVGVEIPMDVLAQKAAVDEPIAHNDPHHPPVDTALLEQAAELLANAKQPMIFVGSGALEMSSQVRALSDILQAPVVSYRTGKGIQDERHYLALQQPPAREYWANADVVIALGSQMRVPLQRWATDHRPKIIRIDVDPTTHRRFTNPDVAITARLEDALPSLIAAVDTRNPARESREAELSDLRGRWADEVSVLEPQLSYLAAIRDAIGEEGVFVDELTQVGFASRIAWQTYAPRTYITTGYQGTLGYGFPTALGVKVARPDIPVVSITGDGGFMFCVQELATAVQHQIPVIVVLFNNNQYGNIQQMQKVDYGGKVIASDLVNPDFIELAKAHGANGIRVDGPQALREAIIASLDVTGPTIIEVPVGDMPSADRFR